jgi:hypothetical protein
LRAALPWLHRTFHVRLRSLCLRCCSCLRNKETTRKPPPLIYALPLIDVTLIVTGPVSPPLPSLDPLRRRTYTVHHGRVSLIRVSSSLAPSPGQPAKPATTTTRLFETAQDRFMRLASGYCASDTRPFFCRRIAAQTNHILGASGSLSWSGSSGKSTPQHASQRGTT